MKDVRLNLVFVLLDWLHRATLPNHVMWANHSRNLQTLFDGIPYVVLGRRTMECRYGPERHGAMKEAKKNGLMVILFLCFGIFVVFDTNLDEEKQNKLLT